MTIEPLRVASSSMLSVRLRSADNGLRINISVERSAIDDHFRLASSTADLRRRIVEANLAAFAARIFLKIARLSSTLMCTV
jgi:hypothetical protein